MIPFSPPRIDELVINEVIDTLKSGWITTGPKTKRFEKLLAEYTNSQNVICLSSATAGLELVLRWFGVKPGDEVILPAYTYTATANVVLHCGAKPVMADVNSDDFNINVNILKTLINKNTKVIIPVDFAGLPCDYDKINQLVSQEDVVKLFSPQTEEQQKLGRILVLADAAHSIGAIYKGKKSGALTDITVFSFHAVKNLTTAEGGAISFNFNEAFDNQELYNFFNIFSLHGQNKDALAKTKRGNWKYDILMPGYKFNMTDIMASIGIVELQRYDNDMLIKRRHIFNRYTDAFAKYQWAETPIFETADKISSFHIYALRIRHISEEERDTIIQKMFDNEISVNVHFKPLPMFSLYKELGYKIEDYPHSFDNYMREISLPVYYDLTDIQINTITTTLIRIIETLKCKE